MEEGRTGMTEVEEQAGLSCNTPQGGTPLKERTEKAK